MLQNKNKLLLTLVQFVHYVSCKSHGGGNGSAGVTAGLVDRDKLTPADYKLLSETMAQHVALHEPRTWLVMIIFVTPLFLVLISLLIMSKLKILLFKDEDE